MEAADPHRMSPTMTSSPPPKRSARHSRATLSARRIRIPNTRWPGCPGSLPVSADGIATTSRPVQRPCEPAGPNSPTGPKAIVLQWLCKMCESRSPPGEGKKNPSAGTTHWRGHNRHTNVAITPAKALGKAPGGGCPKAPASPLSPARESQRATRPHTDIAFYGIVTAGRFAPCQQRIVSMKLTRLRLHGFKSFVEPTDFLIEPGLTGVVAPNGCGKSNLVEALRWAMGETSHKSLRAADMDAVIFAGSGNRPSRNHAEVVMTIDNADRSAPAAVNDREILEISRRIAREAGSVYRINGRDVRARDVQILFADAATGARSPALVHQGKFGEIIQAKPEQRRRVLEDAAGVAGLHARRHEAELRLKAAETNLTRVEDVIGQLAGQIDGLKKQARQAIRYREVAAKVRKAEAMLFHLRWLEANSDVADATRTHDLSGRDMAERTREQAEAARIQAVRASELPALREAEARAAAGLQRLTNARETLDREEERAKERVAELDRRLTQFASDVEREQRQSSDAEVALGRLDAEDALLKDEIKSRVEKRGGADQRVSEAESTLAAAERLFAEITADLTAKRNQLEAGVRTHRDRLARLDQEIAGVATEEQKLAQETSGLGDLEALAGAMETAQESLAQSEAAAQGSEAGHVAARSRLEAARAPLNEADKRVQRLETEARTISKLVNSETKNLWPPIIDGVTVAKGYEKAIGAALGDDLDAPVDPSAPMRWTNSGVPQGAPALPRGG